MRLIGRAFRQDLKDRPPDVAPGADSWMAETSEAQWDTPMDIKRRYPSASLLGDSQVIFNLQGNKYRLLVLVDYKNKTVLIKNAGTHQEYTKWPTR